LKANKSEITEDDIKSLFSVQLTEGYMLMSPEWLAYCEWTFWRATFVLPKTDIDDHLL
jgi:hypothetical protein